MRNNRFVAAVLTPVFALLLLFNVLPIFLGLGFSLFNYKPLNKIQPFVGLDNYTKFFHDPVSLIALKNTLIFVVVTVALNIIITLVLAQAISSMKRGWMRGFMRVVFFMPCVAPLVAASVVWRGLYDLQFGLFNNFLALFGITPHNWLGTAATLMPSIILFTLWADIGYNIIIFTAGIDGIPTDMYEAAAIDGANTLQRFFRITLPMLARTMSFVIAMTLISHFQMFAQFITLIRASGPATGGPSNAGMVLTLDIYKTAFKYNDMGYASAIALALFVLIMIFTVVSRRLNRVDWGY